MGAEAEDAAVGVVEIVVRAEEVVADVDVDSVRVIGPVDAGRRGRRETG